MPDVDESLELQKYEGTMPAYESGMCCIYIGFCGLPLSGENSNASESDGVAAVFRVSVTGAPGKACVDKLPRLFPAGYNWSASSVRELENGQLFVQWLAYCWSWKDMAAPSGTIAPPRSYVWINARLWRTRGHLPSSIYWQLI